MNAITDVVSHDSGMSSDSASAPNQFTLRRSGRKAVKFSGWQMVEATGAGETAPMWYDLRLYRSDTNQFIVELVARRQQLDEQDLCRVEVFDTLEAASLWLENYACANDVPVPAALVDGAAPMAAAVLHAVQLRQRIARIGEEFHSLLSDVFEVLDVTDRVSGEAG